MTLVYIVIGLVILLFVLYMMGPREYDVERSIDIAKSPSEVYNYVRHIKNQDDWGPWAKMDPNIQQTYVGNDGEVGFISKWKGNKQVGEGQQQIVELVQNEKVATHMKFIKPFKAESDIELRLKGRDNGGTIITWYMHGDHDNAVSRIFGLFMNMDKAIGKDFEKGLSALKEILES